MVLRGEPRDGVSLCPFLGATAKGGSGVGLRPKETIQVDGEWDSDVAGIVGEL